MRRIVAEPLAGGNSKQADICGDFMKKSGQYDGIPKMNAILLVLALAKH